MHPRIRSFLEARDKARVRNDFGMIRAMTAELQRLGVPETATLSDPNGKQARKNGTEKRTEVPDEKRGRGRPPKPRCEHGAIADRCAECEQAEIDETLAEAR